MVFLLALNILARTLAGECGDLGPAAYVLTASTAQARLEAGGYGDTLLEVVDSGYYADAPATGQSMAVAWALVTGRVPAVGLLWAYSEDDMRRMGWGSGDVIVRGQGLELHLARSAPWGGADG